MQSGSWSDHVFVEVKVQTIDAAVIECNGQVLMTFACLHVALRAVFFVLTSGAQRGTEILRRRTQHFFLQQCEQSVWFTDAFASATGCISDRDERNRRRQIEQRDQRLKLSCSLCVCVLHDGSAITSAQSRGIGLIQSVPSSS
jgi:hypothetical protein